jgi:hypothetical protein
MAFHKMTFVRSGRLRGYFLFARVAFVEGQTFPKDSEMPEDRAHAIRPQLLLRLLLQQERLSHTQPQRQKQISSSRMFFFLSYSSAHLIETTGLDYGSQEGKAMSQTIMKPLFVVGVSLPMISSRSLIDSSPLLPNGA